ncbi:hypothetical protein MMC30_008072 [Trapelia coarctata]|nr:hypothetical protein [Trapelia coarctata]
MENGYSKPKDAERLGPKETPSEEETSDVSTTAGHKRTLSGSILSKLSFLRSSLETRDTGTATPQTDGTHDTLEGLRSPDTTTLSALEQKKTRRRKGSLRKTAILGTGRLRLEGRDKRNFPLEKIISPGTESSKALDDAPTVTSPTSPDSADDAPTPRQSYEKSTPTYVPNPNNTLHNLGQAHDMGSDDNLPLATLSRKSTLGDMSTTDEDDALTFSRTSTLSNSVPALKKPSGGDSYFPIAPVSLQRRRSSNKPKSPLASLPLEPIPAPEEWDYSETEWWGWVVLVVTWIVFVVGMGSCFGVWSWAWDVGETPYAPPELEDDPTLPIVGYYPALIILTAVMAWVWVVVAWVGMKYFKHAKISGEDM